MSDNMCEHGRIKELGCLACKAAEIARLKEEVERLKGNYYIGRASFLEEQVATLRASLAAAEKRVQELREIIGDCACSQCKQIRQILGG